MPTPRLAPSLVVLRDEVNALFPRRDKASDGWLGDTAHQARPSSHNPNAQGIVRGLDVDVDDNDPTRDLRQLVVAAAIADERTWYVISNGVIYSRTHNFAARTYTGANSHFKHVHISLLEEPAAWNDTQPWLTKEDDMLTPDEIEQVAQRAAQLTTERIMKRFGIDDPDLEQDRSLAGTLTEIQRQLMAIQKKLGAK